MSEERVRYGGPPVYRAPTGSEFRQLLKAWSLTGTAAGDQVGVNGRQIRRYTGEQTPAPYAVLFTLAMKNEGIMISQDRWRAELQSTLTRSEKEEGIATSLRAVSKVELN